MAPVGVDEVDRPTAAVGMNESDGLTIRREDRAEVTPPGRAEPRDRPEQHDAPKQCRDKLHDPTLRAAYVRKRCALLSESGGVARSASVIAALGCASVAPMSRPGPPSGLRRRQIALPESARWSSRSCATWARPSAGRARFGVTGRSRRPLPRLPRAALVPPVRADGRTRSAR